MEKRTQLRQTSRVNEKIMEYWKLFGQERDLDKFMRLDSPASSHHSVGAHTDRHCSCVPSTTTKTTTASCHSCCDNILSDGSGEGSTLRQLFNEEQSEFLVVARKPKPVNQAEIRSKSRLRRAISCAESMKVHSAEEIAIPIQFKNPDNGNYLCVSADDVRTPQKTQTTTTKETQTPESVVKSHKRLEWDSLGDVGYKKSSSTSNISTLERSVLKEMLQDGTMPEKSNKNRTNASESDLKHLQTEQGTPPLASSTFVEPYSRGARPKSTQTTASRLPKLHDQSAQTSSRISMESRSVQATPSLFGSSATPSSFEYFSSRSSTATSNYTGTSRTRSHTKKNPQAYIAHLNEIISRRQVLVEKNQHSTGSNQEQNNSLEATLRNAANLLTEDKENIKAKNSTKSSTTTSTARSSINIENCAPELDLGIQLLCSLVDAKSLNHSQKKRLIRDIAKRISCLDGLSNISTTVTATRTTISSSNASGREHRSQKISDMINNAKDVCGQSTMSSAERAEPTKNLICNNIPPALASDRNGTSMSVKSTQQRGGEQKAQAVNDAFDNVATEDEKNSVKCATSATSETTTDFPITTTTTSSNTSSTSSKDASTQKIKMPETNVASIGVTVVDACEESQTDLEQGTMREWLNPMTQSEIEYEEKRKSVTKIMPKAGHKKRTKHQNQMATTESNENDGECILQLNWIESEIQRLESLRLLLNKVVINADEKKDTGGSASDELQINVDSIGRSGVDASNSKSEERVYDSVNSDNDVELNIDINKKVENKTNKCKTQSLPSTTHSSPPRKLPNKSKPKKAVKKFACDAPCSTVKIPIEQDELKFSDTQRHDATLAKHLPPSPRSATHDQRSKLETPQLNVQPIMANNNQRDKLPTPTSSCATSVGNAGTESVCSFVQQRKRDFIEHYNNKKREQLELLMQQKEQEQTEIEHRREKQLRQQRRNQKEQRRSHSHNLYQHQPQQHQQQHHHQQQLCNCQHHHAHYYHVANANSCQKLSCACATAVGAGVEPHVYYQVVPIMQTLHKNLQTDDGANAAGYSRMAAVATNRAETVKIISSNAVAGASSASAELDGRNRHNTMSTSSSLFCMSSEISIPMGTSNSVGGTTTTTTTTHQYDDVAGVCAGALGATACGVTKSVGVQTGNSMRRTSILFSARCENKEFKSDEIPTTTTTTSKTQLTDVRTQTACVQVRPRGIAYVIEFTDEPPPPQQAGSDEQQHCEATSSSGIVAPTLSLQDHLQRSRPKFCAKSKERKSILNHMQMMRAERRRELENIIENASFSSLDRRLAKLPPAPTSRLRIFSTREMKALTNKRCKILPEVLERQQRENEDRRRRGNRLIRDVFNRRLQRRVRSGKISLNHSRTVI